MCFIESDWLLHRHTFGRRQLFGTGLAAGLAATAGLAGRAEASSLLPGLTVGAQAPPRSGGPGTSGVRFTWFGTNGWEITFGNKTILVDPWFVRSDIGFFSGKFNASAPLQVNEALINQHITRADQILIGHGHWDHIMEIPFIAKKTGAQVIGSETHANIMRAFGVEEGKIVQVKGGEVMTFDGYTIEVFPGLHSLGPTKKYAVPGHRVSVPTTPATVGELPEGDTLIYLITIGAKYSIFIMSSANYIERSLAGIRPDVALVASIFANQIHDFTPRLLRALNNPKVILPTHWDNFERPFSEGPRDLRDVFGDAGNLDLWVRDVKRASPQSNVVVMKFFDSYAP
jgi:L-ascorbate metabolism protein UlaG (beta-lactamase superfamily)